MTTETDVADTAVARSTASSKIPILRPFMTIKNTGSAISTPETTINSAAVALLKKIGQIRPAPSRPPPRAANLSTKLLNTSGFTAAGNK